MPEPVASDPGPGHRSPARLVVLLSGTGTLLQALLDATLQDFAPIYGRLASAADIAIEAVGSAMHASGSKAGPAIA